MDQISFREGYKYQLVEDYSVVVPILPDEDISGRFVRLTSKGVLTIREDYAWDGPSGPTADTLSVMRGSLVHDALYQLMREGQLDIGKWRAIVDLVFLNIMLEDKVFSLRAQAWYRGVATFGEPNASPINDKPTIKAPHTGESDEWT